MSLPACHYPHVTFHTGGIGSDRLQPTNHCPSSAADVNNRLVAQLNIARETVAIGADLSHGFKITISNRNVPKLLTNIDL
jgi:hypothetical protein